MDSYALGLSLIVGVIVFLAVYLPGLFWIWKAKADPSVVEFVKIGTTDDGRTPVYLRRDVDHLRAAFEASRRL